jgi:protein-S-isoprenylcysteine O-methyltransferase Ste14
MVVLKIIYWLGIVLQIVIRYPFQNTWKAGAKSVQRVSRSEQILLGLLSLALIPVVIYTFTGWLDFANYALPEWIGGLGVLLLACSLVLFALSHRDLKSNWSPSLEIFKDHTLVTDGIYRHIRHPMYASQWLFVIAQILLLQNWLAGPANLIVFIPFYFLRVPAEEKLMLEIFGDAYREYMKKTGAIIPRF